ncbi:MAG: type IV pilus modification PilV family protein [Alphaproteobacteria bacterium]|jgi:prepilin-type N-terminal cleavage/methylation domain-containing protein
MPSYHDRHGAMNDHTPTSALSGRQSGMTLIEIMITIVVLSILVLGISGLWANVTGDFIALTIRQKAIFVLNGEMARLSALFRFGNYKPFVEGNSRNYTEIPKTRDIFPESGSGSATVDEIVVTSAQGTFSCGNNTCAGSVLYIDNPLSGGQRNYVWIDQARNIVGELSWRFRDDNTVIPVNANICFETPCRELTVYLRFPLRYQDDTTTPLRPEFGRLETLSLITIVGERP